MYDPRKDPLWDPEYFALHVFGAEPKPHLPGLGKPTESYRNRRTDSSTLSHPNSTQTDTDRGAGRVAGPTTEATR